MDLIELYLLTYFLAHIRSLHFSFVFICSWICYIHLASLQYPITWMMIINKLGIWHYEKLSFYSFFHKKRSSAFHIHCSLHEIFRTNKYEKSCFSILRMSCITKTKSKSGQSVCVRVYVDFSIESCTFARYGDRSTVCVCWITYYCANASFCIEQMHTHGVDRAK